MAIGLWVPIGFRLTVGAYAAPEMRYGVKMCIRNLHIPLLDYIATVLFYVSFSFLWAYYLISEHV